MANIKKEQGVEWIYRFLVLGGIGWLVSTVQGIPVIVQKIQDHDRRLNEVDNRFQRIEAAIYVTPWEKSISYHARETLKKTKETELKLDSAHAQIEQVDSSLAFEHN